MPKKPAKKTTAKKVSKTKSTVKKSAPKSAPRKVAPVKSVSKTNGYLVKEQEDFHRDHPNAFNLIAMFLVLFMSLVLVYFYKNGMLF